MTWRRIHNGTWVSQCLRPFEMEIMMMRQLCLAVLALGLCSVVTPQSQALAQLLSIGPGGVQYNGLGVGYYGPQYGPVAPRVRTYSAYGNGLYGYGPAYGNQWN